MAINILKQPEGIYPAYNDSFIEFETDLIDHKRAEITIFPTSIFPRVFLVYPDLDGNYIFNLKEAIKVIFNASGFEDENFVTNVYWKSLIGLYLEQQIQIKIYSDSDSEILLKTFEFFKAVKQVGEPIHENPYQLLTYSSNGINHYMTYFEGFPFHFDIQRVEDLPNREITVKSLNNGVVSPVMSPTFTGAFRINVDRGGGNNWNNDSFLPLIDGLNRLEIYEENNFKCNLFLKKKRKCSGIYLKWFNRNGGFSHYLFDEFFVSQTKSKEIGKVFNDEFQNINNATGNNKSIGKNASGTINIKAKYEKEDYQNLLDLFTSPLVQMYTSQVADVEGVFVDVFVDGTISNSNKKGKNEIALIVDLPEVITAIL